jgi:peptidoglycan hydrolase CwlO-like protein
MINQFFLIDNLNIFISILSFLAIVEPLKLILACTIATVIIISSIIILMPVGDRILDRIYKGSAIIGSGAAGYAAASSSGKDSDKDSERDRKIQQNEEDIEELKREVAEEAKKRMAAEAELVATKAELADNSKMIEELKEIIANINASSSSN